MSDDGSKLSKFNSGVSHVERINELQVTMNTARFNPLVMNPQFMKWNYEIMINAQDCLLYECWAKLGKDEKEKGDKIKDLVHKIVKLKPILKKAHNGEWLVNQDNFEKFLELIDIYEKSNKIFLDKHNLNSPDQENDEGL